MTDHAKAARQAVIAMRKHYMETGMTDTGTLDDEIDALAAERDALLAYAKMLEDPALDGHMFLNNRQRERTREIWRVDSNVAHLFD